MNLKEKNGLLKYLVFFSISILLLSSCTASHSIERSKVDFGIVLTTDNLYSSEILWFDKKLSNIQKQWLGYARLGSHFYQPIKKHNSFYLIPQGLGNRKDTKKVISINRSNFKIKEYPFSDTGLNCAAVIDDNVYAVNSGMHDSYIESYSCTTKKYKSYTLKNQYTDPIIGVGDKLYVFTCYDQHEGDFKIYLEILSSELELEKRIDLTEYGIVNDKFVEDDNYIILTVALDKYDEYTGKILKINKKTYELEVHDTKYKCPFDIYKYKSGYIISYFEPVSHEGTKVSIVDENWTERIYDLHTKLDLTAIKGDDFIVASEDKVLVYSISQGFKKISERKIKKGGKYLSSILVL